MLNVYGSIWNRVTTVYYLLTKLKMASWESVTEYFAYSYKKRWVYALCARWKHLYSGIHRNANGSV